MTSLRNTITSLLLLLVWQSSISQLHGAAGDGCACGKSKVMIRATPNTAPIKLLVDGGNPVEKAMEPDKEYTFAITADTSNGWKEAVTCAVAKIVFPMCGIEYRTTDTATGVSSGWTRGSEFQVNLSISGGNTLKLTPNSFQLRLTDACSDHKPRQAGAPGGITTEPPVPASNGAIPPGASITPPGAGVSIPLGVAGLGPAGAAPYRSAGTLHCGGPVSAALALPVNFECNSILDVAGAVDKHEMKDEAGQLQAIHFIGTHTVTLLTGWNSATEKEAPAATAEETFAASYPSTQYDADFRKFSGNPLVSWKVLRHVSGAASGVRLVMEADGATTETLVYSSSANHLVRVAGGITEVTEITQPNTLADPYYETVTRTRDGVPVSKVRREYTKYSWGYETTASTVYQDPAATTGGLATFTIYYDTPADPATHRHVRAVSQPDGGWTLYEYYGNTAKSTSPFCSGTLLDLQTLTVTPNGSGPNAGRVVTTVTTSNFPGTSVSVTNLTGGTGSVAQLSSSNTSTTYPFTAGVSGDSIPDGAPLRDVSGDHGRHSVSYSADLSGNLAWLAERPLLTYQFNGMATLFEYDRDPVTGVITTTTTEGVTDPPGMGDRDIVAGEGGASFSVVPSVSTRTVTVHGTYGPATETIECHTGSGWTAAHTTTYFYDGTGRQTEVKRNGFTIAKTTYPSALVREEYDATGAKTTYTYDAGGDIVSSVRADGGGVPAIATTYHRSGLTLTTKVNGAIDSVETSDGLGRTVETMDRIGVITTYAYGSGGREITTTRPGNVTRVETRHFDGRLASVTGNASVNEFHTYDIESYTDGSDTRTTLAHTICLGFADSPRRSVTFLDAEGRVAATRSPNPEAPGQTNQDIFRYHDYNSLGERWRTRTNLPTRFPVEITAREMPGSTLAEQRSGRMGAIRHSGTDINGNGTLLPADEDRMTSSVSTYVVTGGAVYQRTASTAYPTTNPADAIITTTVRSITPLAVNFPPYGTGYSETASTSRAGRTTTQTRIVLFDSATEVTVADDSATTGSSEDEKTVSVNGYVQSTRRAIDTADSTYAYNFMGRVTRFTDSRGNTTLYYYTDNPHQLGKTVNHLGQTTSFTYYPPGHANAGLERYVTDPSGTTETIYNTRGQVTEVTGNPTYHQVIGYNSLGERVTLQTFGTQSATTTWIFDPATGLLTRKEYHNGRGTSYSYYADGRTKTRTWQRGVITTYTYSEATRDLTAIDYSDTTQPDDVTFSDFDLFGRPMTVHENRGGDIDITHLTYDNFSGALSTYYNWYSLPGSDHSVLPKLALIANAPDIYGRATGSTATQDNASINAWTDGYDAYGRMNSLTSGTFASLATFHPGTATPDVRTTSVGGNTVHTATRAIDPLRRTTGVVSQAPDPANANAMRTIASICHTYDSHNWRDTAVREDGTWWDYGYNDRGEVTTADKKLGVQLVPGQNLSYAYDGIGNRTSAKYTTYTPNALNQYSQITTSGQADVLVRAPDRVTASVPGASSVVVTPATNEPSVLDYYNAHVAADNSGGGKFLTATLSTTTPPTSASGKLWIPPATVEPAYDFDGNLLADGRWQYTWNAENRLIGMNPTAGAIAAGCPNRTLTFTYDFVGRRIGRKVTEGATTLSDTRYLYDGWNLAAEFAATSDNTLTLLRSYLWGPDLSDSPQGAGGVGGLLAVCLPAPVTVAGGQISILIPSYDANGNIIAYSDQAGRLVQRRDYDPFGNPIVTETLLSGGEVLASHLTFGFSTKPRDPETGLLYYGYRWYDPLTGRWPTRDPIGERGGVNLYGFIGNDPVDGLDVFGLSDGVRHVTKRLLAIFGPDNKGPEKERVSPEASSEWYDRFRYAYKSPLDKNSDLTRIHKHNWTGIVDKRHLETLVDWAKTDWEKDNPHKKCCVKFVSSHVQGNSSNPVTPRMLRDVMESQHKQNSFDKIILAVHWSLTEKREPGIFLAIDKSVPEKDSSGHTKLTYVWGATYLLKDLFSEFPKGNTTLSIYTCFTDDLPKSVDGLTIEPLGNKDDVSLAQDYKDRALKPWVYSECNKQNASK